MIKVEKEPNAVEFFELKSETFFRFDEYNFHSILYCFQIIPILAKIHKISFLVEFCQSKKFMLNINCISIIYFMSFILLPYTKCNIFILIAYMQLQSTMAMQIRLNSMIVHKMHVNIKCSLFIFIWYIISIKRKYSLL